MTGRQEDTKFSGISQMLHAVYERVGRSRIISEESGANLIEMSIALPVFLIFLFGVIQMSYAIYTMHVVANAAREGSRWAAVRGSTCYGNLSSSTACSTSTGAGNTQITAFIKSLGYPGVDGSKLTVSTSWLTANSTNTNGVVTTSWSTCTSSSTVTCNLPGNIVRVTVSYPFWLSIPLWRATTFSISSTSGMVIAQ
jgi:Flp pilus assembly protein TadG